MESIGSASQYGLKYAENAFVKCQKIIVGSVVHAAELNWKWIFFFMTSVLWPRICRKCVFSRGFAPNPTGGAHDVPPDPLVGCGGDTPPQTLPHSAPLVPRPSRLRRSGLPPVHIISGYTTVTYWPFKVQWRQMVTFQSVQCHPGLTYMFNFRHSGTLALRRSGLSARVPECQKLKM